MVLLRAMKAARTVLLNLLPLALSGCAGVLGPAANPVPEDFSLGGYEQVLVERLEGEEGSALSVDVANRLVETGWFERAGEPSAVGEPIVLQRVAQVQTPADEATTEEPGATLLVNGKVLRHKYYERLHFAEFQMVRRGEAWLRAEFHFIKEGAKKPFGAKRIGAREIEIERGSGLPDQIDRQKLFAICREKIVDAFAGSFLAGVGEEEETGNLDPAISAPAP